MIKKIIETFLFKENIDDKIVIDNIEIKENIIDKPLDNVAKFNNIIDFACEVIYITETWKREYPNLCTYSKDHPIIDVIRLLGRKFQSEYFTNVLEQRTDSELPNIDLDTIFFDYTVELTKDGKKFLNIIEKRDIDKNVYLDKDIILPWPWQRERLANNIASIGEGRVNGKWKQDNNHRVYLYLPIGVSFVGGGNHSLTTGIIQGDGIVRPNGIYDITTVYNYVKCDGKNYIRIEDEQIISPVYNIEFAAIFEIGRIMIEKGISF
jgi:hypothetical protein